MSIMHYARQPKFLNGLLSNICTSMKLQAATTMGQAVDAAISVAKAIKGPSEVTTDVHQIGKEWSPDDNAPTEAETDAMVPHFMKQCIFK